MVGAFVRWLLYSTWFSTALVAFIYLSIPETKLKRFVQHHATNAMKSQVKIDSLEVRGISGVTLGGVRVELPLPKANDPAMPGGPKSEPTPASALTGDDETPEIETTQVPGYIIADELRVDVNTIGLLTGKPLQAALNADISGGTITDLSVSAGTDGWKVDLGTIESLDLAPMRLTRTLLKSDLDLHGRLSGSGNLLYSDGLANSKGELKLELADALIPYVGMKDPRSGFLIGEMFQVAIGDVELAVQLDRAEDLSGLRRRSRANHTTLLIEKLIGRGDHIEVQLDGGQQHTITFSGPTTGDADIDVKLVVHFTDAFFAWKGDGVRGDGVEAKGVSHSALKTALQMQLRRAQTKVGAKTYYGFHCRGKLRSFKCPPSAPSRRIEPVKAKAKPEQKTPSVSGNEPLKRPKAPTASATEKRSSNAKRRLKRDNPKPPKLSRRTRPAGTLSEPSRPNSEVKERLARSRARTRRGMKGDMLAPREDDESEDLEEEAPAEEVEDGPVVEEEREEDNGEADDEEDGIPEDGEPLDDEEEAVDEDDEYDEDE